MFLEKNPADPVNIATAMHKAATPALLDGLKKVLADAEVFTVKAHGYHWNVTGPDFAQYHELFGDIYSDVYDSIDPIAENIRKLGDQTPASLQEFSRLASVSDMNIGIAQPSMMAGDLQRNNKAMITDLEAAFAAANSANEQGIANFLAERIDMHQKWDWQLSASLTKAAPMKTEDGIAFPAAAFAYVPDSTMPSTWKLRLWETPADKETARQIGMAVAALGAGFRGNKVEIPAADKAMVLARVRNAWKKIHGKDEEMPEALA